MKKPVAKKTTKVANVAKETKTVEVQKIPTGMTAKKAATLLNKVIKAKAAQEDAPEKAAKVAKTTKATKTVAKAATTPRAPNPIVEKCIALMLRKEGAGIADFQTVEGFNLPSMAIVKAAQRAGYKAEASKQPGERTVYKASRP
jgi:hypothetical protein